MQNKGFVIGLTLIVTALCLYYLSFSYVSRGVQDSALEYATDENGVFDFRKKQAYIDSVWNAPVFTLFGYEYTYSEVTEKELSLGLDLQGGMQVTLEVSPIDILKSLAGQSQDPDFQKALEEATQKQKSSQENYSTLFFEAFKNNNPNKKLSTIFANPSTLGRIDLDDTDEEIITYIDTQIEEAIDRSYIILSNRINQFGTSSPNIQRIKNTGRIQIEIPGADNPKRIRKLLQGVAKLEFFDVTEPYAINTSLNAINTLLAQEKATKKEDPLDSLIEANLEEDTLGITEALDSLKEENISPLLSLSSPRGTYRYDLKDTAQVGQYFRKPEIAGMLPPNVKLFWAYKPEKYRSSDANEEPKLQLYFLDVRRGEPRLTGEAVTDARAQYDQGGFQVHMTMDNEGTKEWAKWTKEAAANNNSRIAIVLDNIVYSAPSVNEEIPYGISSISGSFTEEEASDLANILEAGSLPAPTRIVEEEIIGPTLGQVARNNGLISVVSGLALVVIFMIAYYAKGGLVANLALLFNIFFILGILAQPSLATALTLPGIAGIVLTMGMAVDANVLIFERIKEEMQHGRKLKSAIKSGYQKSFWTIFDSNLTTFITGLLLFVFGQGPIKGFATTLMIGIVTSFFSSIYISRVFVGWFTRNGDESKVSFETALSRLIKRSKDIDFIKNSRIAYYISSAIIVVGLALLFVKGLNLGVDFKGGRSYVVSFNQPVSATALKSKLAESFDNKGTEVKNYGGNNIMKVTTSYLIDEESTEADDAVRKALITGLESQFPEMKFTENEAQVDDHHFAITKSTKVGATVADDIKDSAWEASLFSLLGIFLYILLRFRKWQFSVGAIVALIHDVLFVVALFSFANILGMELEVDQVFVAAILTIMGYSINDTVIIFDRIRENLGLGTSHDRFHIFNHAINETLGRTFITAGTTLLVVLVLLIFGGEALLGFSFAFLIGVIVGTYSSIFIASPIVLDLDSGSRSNKKETASTKKTAVA